MPNKSTPERLDADNRALRARLETAEATLSEILSGESDALFVTGAGGAQLFTLKGADQSYRKLIENMSEGALTLTSEGLVLYANRRFAEMLRTPLERVIGSGMYNWFAPESRQAIQALLRKDAVDNRREELALVAADGTHVPVNLSVSRLVLEATPDALCMVVTDLTEQKRNEAILAADKLANAILEQAADAIMICDETGRIIRASKLAQTFYGKSPVGQLFEHTFPLRHLDGTVFSPVDTMDLNHHQSVEARLEHDGQRFDFLVSVGHLNGARNELLGSVVTLQDITERKVADAKLLRHTQLYEALSQCNQAIVRCASKEELFQQICHIAVQFGGMKMAWVGLVDSDIRMVRPVASFGDGTAYLEDIEISVDAASPFGQGPVGISIRDNQPFWCRDFMNDPITVPWQKLGVRFDWGALASLPLRRIGVVVGVFVLYSGEVDSFDEPARNLLVEMAGDISFALDNFTRESQRKRAEEELKFKNSILQTQQETSPDAILVVDENSQIISYNQQFVHLWRISPQIVSTGLDAPVLQSVSDQVENPEAFVTRVQYLFAHRDDKSHEEIQLKDGRIIDRYSAPANGPDGRHYGRVWYFRDITERIHAAQELRESERRFSDLLGNIELVSVMLDREGQITYCNDYLLRLTGWRHEEVIGRNWFDVFMPPEFGNLKDEFLPALLADLPEARHHENEILTQSGGRRLIHWNNSMLRSGAGDVIGTASIGEDITEKKESEASIKYLNRVLSVLSGINTLIVRVNDRDELFREACNIAVGVGGFRMAMIVILDRSTMLPALITSAGKDEELQEAIKIVMSSGENMQKSLVALAIREKKAVISNDTQNDPRLLFGKQYTEAGVKSMTVLPLIISGEAVGTLALYASEIEFFKEDEMRLLTELAGDIAFAIDHVDKQDRLNYLAYFDELTGLANRSLFHERVAQHMDSAARGGYGLAMGVIDLERFKSINDSLGRNTGDALLKQVAEWLSKNMGGAKRLARVGADHFAFVMPEVLQEGNLLKLFDNTAQAFLEHPFQLKDAVFRISAKAGIALFPDDGIDFDTLFKHAEAALKMAKAGGDRYLFYTRKMTEAVAGNLTLENRLRQAIDNEEFVLHYQPKVNLVSGMVTSAEALIRWNDPKTGLVPPGVFIPILEETGLIFEVGRWALHQAIADYLRWSNAGLSAVRIAVNVSPLQLRNINFIEEIRQATTLDVHAAAGLELEITESVIMDNVEHNIDTLQEIRAMGITIAIDDFGTGYSSLSYLAKLPVDTLKIDRVFVIEMDTPQGLALVSTIIIVAHALKLKVVAEGVETEKQLRQLLSLNCDEMQGFLFSKPVPAEIFETRFLASLAPGDMQ